MDHDMLLAKEELTVSVNSRALNEEKLKFVCYPTVV